MIVSLGDLYSDVCTVCGQRGSWGVASRKGPEGCIEATQTGKIFCFKHLPQEEHDALMTNAGKILAGLIPSDYEAI